MWFVNTTTASGIYTQHKESEVCMNNTVNNDFFGFPKVKWLQYTGEVMYY